MGDEVDPVAGARGQRGQQQRRVHRGVEPWRVADPAGGGAAGVEDEQDVPVALGPPGAHHDVAGAERRAPVDRADVVARRRTRAASRTRCPGRAPGRRCARRGRAAGPACSAGACEVNGGSTRTRHGAACEPCRAASPSGPYERTVTRSAGRSPRRVGTSSGREAGVPGGRSTGCRLPRAPADGGHASRTTPRTRRPLWLLTRKRDRRLARPAVPTGGRDRDIQGVDGPGAGRGRRRPDATSTSTATPRPGRTAPPGTTTPRASSATPAR